LEKFCANDARQIAKPIETENEGAFAGFWEEISNNRYSSTNDLLPGVLPLSHAAVNGADT
jgi:hypothetical protein